MPREILWQNLVDHEDEFLKYKDNTVATSEFHEDLDHGLALHTLNHRIPLISTLILRLFGLPQSNITKSEIENWRTDIDDMEILDGVGMFIAFGKFELFDIGWLEVIWNYILVHLGLKRLHCFRTEHVHKDWTHDGVFRINMVADFGTGIWKDGTQKWCPAALIQKLMEENQAEVHVHLGDIYYAGTRKEAERQFLKTWAPGKLASYNMNGNHDLYSGDMGFFHTVLAEHSFIHQKRNSYWSFKAKSWLFIGLDSSYYSDAFFCTEGRIVDPNQISFLQEQTKDHKENVVILTHHGPVSSDGSEELALWTDVTHALGFEPDRWYFGHIHNGMFFKTTILGDVKTKFRCIGCGALPYGLGAKLEKAKNEGRIEWYPTKALENPGPGQARRLMNGYLELEITDSDYQETFYYQDGSIGFQHRLETQ